MSFAPPALNGAEKNSDSRELLGGVRASEKGGRASFLKVLKTVIQVRIPSSIILYPKRIYQQNDASQKILKRGSGKDHFHELSIYEPSSG